jgi:putative hemolysin
LVLSTDLTSTESLPATTQYANAPALIKGYLRCGARLLGSPAVDVAFNTADLPLMLRVNDLAPRYRTHFLGY